MHGSDPKMDNLQNYFLDHILQHTIDLWDEIRGSNIFITGGTGFFGNCLVRSYILANNSLRLGSHITILTRSPESFLTNNPDIADNKCVTLLKGDVRSFSFPSDSYSHLIHAATDINRQNNNINGLETINTIIDGTRRVLDFSVFADVKKVLYISSGAIYGKQPENVTSFSEDYSGAPDPTLPSSSYAEGKRMAEHLCALYSQNGCFETKIARCFAFVGPFLPLTANFAICDFIKSALQGQPIIITGDGSTQRSYLYSADLAIWLWTILFKGSSGQAYNVGSDCGISIIDLARTIATMTHNRSAILFERPTPNVEKGNHYIPSTKKAREGLGLRQLFDLKQSIQSTIDWYSDQPSLLS
jgi:nucleoside-diphosphate-sugar epimerase